MDNTVTILGARGSMGLGGADCLRYGGATTCVLVRISGRAVLLDAGTGFMNPPRDLLDIPVLPLILTHAHIDHLLGLPLSPYVMRRGARLDIYAAARHGLGAEAQVRRFLSPPLWPVGPDQFPADIRFHDLPPELYLYTDGRAAKMSRDRDERAAQASRDRDERAAQASRDADERAAQASRDADGRAAKMSRDADERPAQMSRDSDERPAQAPRDDGVIRVASMDGAHPGGVSLLRLESGGKSVVFFTDCTLTDALRPAALDFARDCSLLLCDGQYSDDEWPARTTFGHNSWRDAAQFARDCRAKQTRIVHHDPFHSDAVLDAASDEIGVPFAREGETILL